MKIKFNDPAEFERLENDAIDGALIYDDFPPEEYKYFSKLAKLGYMNRHKGWSIEICEAKQEEFKKQYYKEKSHNNRFTELSHQVQQNILAGSESIRKIYKAETEEEILKNALQAIEAMTGENGFYDRITNKLKNMQIIKISKK